MAKTILLQEISRAAGIEFIDFHVADGLNALAEPFIEYSATRPMHFREVVLEIAVAIGVDQLEHSLLLSSDPVQLHRGRKQEPLRLSI